MEGRQLFLIFLALQSTFISCSRLRLLENPSGPSPGGNANPLITPNLVEESRHQSPTIPKNQVLDAPSGPNPGGNSKIDGSIKVQLKKVPNQVLDAPSGPNPGGNSKIDGSVKVQVKKVLKNEMLDEHPSGPSPGGNSYLLGNGKLATPGIKPGDIILTKLPKNTPTPNPGPSPIGNSVSKAVKGKKLTVKETELQSKLPNTPTPNPGPSPIGNSVSKVTKAAPTSRLLAAEVDLRSKLPNKPTPTPGPGPGHNSVSKIINKKSTVIECEGDFAPQMNPNLFAAALPIFSHN